MSTELGIFARYFTQIDRAIAVGLASGRVVSVDFQSTVPSDADDDHALLDRIDTYLNGDSDHLADVDIALTVPTDQRRVLEATRNVPYGEEVSLDRILRMAGLDEDKTDDQSTAQRALAENPIPLIVPDHRVRDAPSGAPSDVITQLQDIEQIETVS
ncbi:MGMT family protein [Haloquadratum walsbyi]|jgi:methylated-DNA-[protein]-cysteine S-methyltransferase|uniref:Probable methylated-DNA--protein-cysteine methyltransferase n=1 Tax=Haloquadratum walsbyi (strain DSM 16790 / HBSQ001) TaxID=362976 RepID=Q18DY1_HALWD|nr:MGMT family protein [Haloquadratum walsbyi]CAJ51290.1 probable methylated-DNA--protein-cysteine methyltransferase [Haloquadratum walsbyi DSM 16790]